jgi:hypothetical protein
LPLPLWVAVPLEVPLLSAISAHYQKLLTHGHKID